MLCLVLKHHNHNYTIYCYNTGGSFWQDQMFLLLYVMVPLVMMFFWSVLVALKNTQDRSKSEVHDKSSHGETTWKQKSSESGKNFLKLHVCAEDSIRLPTEIYVGSFIWKLWSLQSRQIEYDCVFTRGFATY